VTETINEQRDGAAPPAPAVTGDAVDERQLAGQLVEQARAEGLRLTGPDGLLGRLTKLVLESALEAELTEHVGYEPHERAGAGNSRNGTRAKTVLTDVGPVELDVPRDRQSTFRAEDRA
jgi:transposase-like protein